MECHIHPTRGNEINKLTKYLKIVQRRNLIQFQSILVSLFQEFFVDVPCGPSETIHNIPKINQQTFIEYQLYSQKLAWQFGG